MTDYTELVKVLRCKRDDCEGCDLAFFDKDEGWMCQYAAKDDDAADAIEALQTENTDIREELFVSQRKYDNFVAVASMENAMLARQMPKRGEIVRCRECKWYQPDLCANPWGVCFHEDWVENNIGHTVDEDGFCYRGEREVQE